VSRLCIGETNSLVLAGLARASSCTCRLFTPEWLMFDMYNFFLPLSAIAPFSSSAWKHVFMLLKGNIFSLHCRRSRRATSSLCANVFLQAGSRLLCSLLLFCEFLKQMFPFHIDYCHNGTANKHWNI